MMIDILANVTMEAETLAGFTKVAKELGYDAKDADAFLAEQQETVL